MCVVHPQQHRTPHLCLSPTLIYWDMKLMLPYSGPGQLKWPRTLSSPFKDTLRCALHPVRRGGTTTNKRAAPSHSQSRAVKNLRKAQRLEPRAARELHTQLTLQVELFEDVRQQLLWQSSPARLLRATCHSRRLPEMQRDSELVDSL